MKKSDLTVIIFYLLLSVALNIKLAMSPNKTSVLMLPEGTPLYSDKYVSMLEGEDGYSWNSFVSVPSMGSIVSYRSLFWLIGSAFNLNLVQLLILIKILFQFLALLGAFFLSKDYLLNSSRNKMNNNTLISSSIAGLIYGLNPSFMVGDSFWVGIQLAFVSLPWVIWSFNKFIVDEKWRYIPICILLMAINVDEHFLWAGFPIILTLYFAFFFTARALKEKKIDFSVLIAFLLLLLIFFATGAYKFIIRFAASPPQFALTKASIDVCWTNASLLNALRSMSHMNLPGMYATSDPFFSFLNLLMPLTLIIPILALLSLILYKKNPNVLFYGTLLLSSLLIFFVGTPFKELHYWIVFNLPFGPAFRTWRIIDSYTALSLSMLIAFSLYYLFEKISTNRNARISIIIGILFTISVYSWPLLTGGDINGWLAPVQVPNEYFSVNSFLSNQTGDFRVIYIPEFTYSYGKYTQLKPFWSPEWGAIQEFLTYSSPKPTLWPNGWWTHFYDFTLSPFYNSLLKKGEINTLSEFLEWANIKYLVIHNDIPLLSEDTKAYINYLNSSNNFKLVFNNTFIYIFENINNKEDVSAQSHSILVDGGYRTVKKFYDNAHSSDDTYDFIFIDQGIPPEVSEKTKLILTDKSDEQLQIELISSELIYKHPDSVIYPYTFTGEYYPTTKWSRASYLDPPQEEWHHYVNWQNYAWDFDYMKGVIFTTNSNDEIQIPVGIHPPGNYTLILRLLTNENGGKIQVALGDRNLFINTYSKYNGFLWYKSGWILDTSTDKIKIKNVNGFNAVNLLALVPSDEFLELEKETDKLFENKTILYVLLGEDDIHVANGYLEKDNSTKGGLILSPGAKVWQELKIIKEGYYEVGMKGEGKFNLTLDTSRSTLYLNNSSFAYSNSVYLQKGLYNITFEPTNILYPHIWDFKSHNQISEWKESTYELGSVYTVFWDEKEQALSAELSGPASGWRVISSPLVPVGYDGGCTFNFSVKPVKGQAINFKIVEFDIKKEIIHETTYGGGIRSTSDWISISYNYTPESSSAAYLQLQIWDGNETTQYYPSVILIGNVTITGESAYLDAVWLYSADCPKTNPSVEDLFKSNEVSANISLNEINPTLWQVRVDTSAPFMLSFSESYNPLWKAVVYKGVKKIDVVEPVPLYGVINGFWINQTGTMDVLITYALQDEFELGLIISRLTVVLCISYLFYDWRRNKGDRWAKRLENRLQIHKLWNHDNS